MSLTPLTRGKGLALAPPAPVPVTSTWITNQTGEPTPKSRTFVIAVVGAPTS